MLFHVDKTLPTTVAKIRKNAHILLPHSPSARLDIDCILSHILHTEKSALISHDERLLTRCEKRITAAALKKRNTGMPVAYIIGKKEFFGREFFVNKNVLIPKSDTELLVETALSLSLPLSLSLSNIAASDSGKPLIRIADVCTGSGCVAISLLASLFSASQDDAFSRIEPQIDASDISRAALTVAKKNARALLPPHIQKRVRLVHADLLNFVPSAATENGGYDIIVSNPPYIPHAVARELLKDGRREPILALSGGKHGTELIEQLVPQSFVALKSGGFLLVEIGENQEKIVQNLFSDAGFTDIIVHTDLSGAPRVLQGVRP
ncbi:MAG: peptide chain release factor N(5)-glutamine methyltransferase [Treponemataceae bacterium]|nr:MAG: peptide chain release factor N(5)-glutamine methyltransferase [Treponemataceae bacterium]